jgi:8-oxo-dGTP diphosphatase
VSTNPSERRERRAFSVATFARHAGKILLIHHRRLGGWLPVGGEIEAGETPLEAARRELREETGLEGRFELVTGVDGTPPGLLGYEEHLAGSKGLHMNFAFVADVDTSTITPNDEVLEHRWVTDPGDLDCPPNVRELARMAIHSARSSLVALAEEWLDAFNARDLDRLVGLYAEDAVHTSPKLRDREPSTMGEIRGKDALRRWWNDAMTRLPTLRYEAQHLVHSGDRVFMEYMRSVAGEAPMSVAEVLVARNGRIIASHVYHG